MSEKYKTPQEVEKEGRWAMDLIAEWKKSPEIRKEFKGSFGTYVYFKEAERDGKVTICGTSGGKTR